MLMGGRLRMCVGAYSTFATKIVSRCFWMLGIFVSLALGFLVSQSVATTGLRIELNALFRIRLQARVYRALLR